MVGKVALQRRTGKQLSIVHKSFGLQKKRGSIEKEGRGGGTSAP